MQTSASELRRFGLTVGGVGAVLFGLLFPWLFDTPTWPLWPWILFGTLAGLGEPSGSIGRGGIQIPRKRNFLFLGWGPQMDFDHFLQNRAFIK